MKTLCCLFLLLSILGFSCSPPSEESSSIAQTALADPPEWAKHAIWYQIFPERFRNGDPTNDPTPADLEGSYPGFVPQGWQPTPWTQDWYAPDPYFEEIMGKVDLAGDTLRRFDQASRLRRYGGDLQGVLDKVDYLHDLGVTAVYFNPLNDAPSDHKYDVRHWRHIDRNFGPTPREDVALMAEENPVDPATWQVTGADQLFVELVEALHAKGIRVIMDYSFNHTGIDFWAWKDLVQNQAQSPYKDWYWVEAFDDPKTPENEFSYRGWFGVKDLPEIKETEYHAHQEKIEAFEGDLADASVKQHIFNVARRWLDPNEDGDLSDGVDGFRLDVAVELPLGFWRDFRKEVRDVNPDAYLVGEIWWEKWPDDLMDPAPFVKGDIFDAVMHYRWYKPTRHFLAQAPDKIAVSEYVNRLQNLRKGIRPGSYQVMMNVAASHDSPRLATSLFNRKQKYKVGTEPNSNPEYKLHRPDAQTWQTQKLLLVQQFTYLGAPHIWAGDEMGMWGADMGDTRKPLIWEDYQFDPEVAHPLGQERPTDVVRFNAETHGFYQQLANLRNEHEFLRTGELTFLIQNDEKEVLAYNRFNEEEEIIAVFNTSEQAQAVAVPVKRGGAYVEYLSGEELSPENGQVELNLSARTAAILIAGPR
jgi:cyclomaltodextrinase